MQAKDRGPGLGLKFPFRSGTVVTIWKHAVQELLLNLTWASLVVAAFALLWHAVAIRQVSRPAVAFIALGCILVLLFPVISVTDDIHHSEFTADEAGSVQKLLKDMQCLQHVPWAKAVAALAESGLLASPRVGDWPLPDEPLLLVGREVSFRRALPDRAPPLPAL